MEEPNRCEVEVELGQMSENERPAGSWLCCLPCYWLKRNSGFHKMSLTVVTLLVTVLLVGSPVLFLISSIPGEKSKDCIHQGEECQEMESEKKVCRTEECSRAGSRILASMSWKANPCEDFYEFACGFWEERGKKAEVFGQVHTKFEQGHFINFASLQQQVDQNIERLLTDAVNSDLFRKLGIFYKSCLLEPTKRTSLDPMVSLLEELGGYVGPKEYPPEDLTELVLNLLRLNGAPLFDIYLDSDLDNSSKWAPFIDLPSSGGFNLAWRHWWHLSDGLVGAEELSEEGDGRSDGEGEGKKKAYDLMKASIEEKRLVLMERILRTLMARNVSSETRVADTQLTLHFADVLKKAYPREKDVMRNSYRRQSTTKMEVGILERKFPFIRWQYLLEKYLAIKMSPSDHVFVSSPDYLDDLQRILHRFAFRVVHNGLLLLFATDTLHDLLNTSSTRNWPAFCRKLTVTTFPEAVSLLYVTQFSQHHTEHLRPKVIRVFNALRNSFARRLEKLSWLDEETREAVSRKLAALRIQFLTWPNYWNTTYATSLMSHVQVHPNRFFENVIQRYRHLRNITATPAPTHHDDQLWPYPFVVNAFYLLTLNTIIIPLALLTHPYFAQEVPLYIPYSTVGLIIAREMLHGFDLRGIGYDSRGNPRPIVSRDSRTKFEARVDCFLKQFSVSFWPKVHFLGTNVDVQFDWNITKNDNMADVTALHLAYQAWTTVSESAPDPALSNVHLSSRQLFFLSAAQTYCAMLTPPEYIFFVDVDFHTSQPERVNGIMMNSPEFAEAYKCPPGSPMNPRKKCSTW